MSDSEVELQSSVPVRRTVVSPARRVFSVIVLLTVLLVLAIELRASIGHSRSVKALTEIAPEGLFEGAAFADAVNRLQLMPVVSTIRSNRDEHVERYHWFSLLRPLVGQPPLDVYLVASPQEPRQALAFYTDLEDAAAGFYGDQVPAENAMEGYEPPLPADPFGIPDAAP